jgi:CRP/FNR family cyclic AMP-dependent transcriptional regulator
MKITKNLFQQYVKTFEPGQVIFKEGETGEVMFVIIQGEVEIRKRTAGTTSKTLITFHEGDIFGEMALIEKKPRSATAIATKASRMLVMNEGLLDKMLENNPDFAKKMIRILSERIRKANLIIQNIAGTNRQNQVFTGLQEFARAKGMSTFKGHRVNIKEFLDWGRSSLGIGEKETTQIIQEFLRRRVVSHSALGKGEILVDVDRVLI